MTETLHVEEGQWPWSPAPKARLVQVIDEFDVPTVGLLEEGDRVFLFRCIDGHAERLSVWMYFPTSPADFPVQGGYDDSIEALVAAADMVTIALADAESGIIRVAEEVHLQAWSSPIVAATEALHLSPEEQKAIGFERTDLYR